MSATDDYCELCDLPKSQCIHGQPPPAEPPATKAPPKPRARRATATRPRTPATTSKPVTRRWTPPEVLAPLIVSVLGDAGGELGPDEVFERLEQEIGDHLRAGDRETTPNGELRWQYAARRARQNLIREGVLDKGPGLWKLA